MLTNKRLLRCAVLWLFICLCPAGCGGKGSRRCTNTVTAFYSGTNVAGEYLPSGARTESRQVQKGDYFGEDPDGHWLFNSSKHKEDIILRVKAVTDDAVTVTVMGEERTCAYGEELPLPSLWVVCDGYNYRYTVSFQSMGD